MSIDDKQFKDFMEKIAVYNELLTQAKDYASIAQLDELENQFLLVKNKYDRSTEALKHYKAYKDLNTGILLFFDFNAQLMKLQHLFVEFKKNHPNFGAERIGDENV